MYLTDSLHRLWTAYGDAPFTTGQAAALGVPAHQLERATRNGQITRLRRGLYSAGKPLVTTAWSLACARAREFHARGLPSVMSSSAGALLWDVPILAEPPPLPTIVVPRGARPGSRGGVRIQLGVIDEADVVRLPVAHRHAGGRRVNDVRRATPDQEEPRSDVYVVTSPLRTALDLGRETSLAPHLAAATMSMGLRRQIQWDEPHVITWDGHRMNIDEQRTDWACTQRIADPHTREVIEAALARCPRQGVRRVREALSMVQPGVETPLEAVSWARMVQAGLPLPQTQTWLRGASGREYRVDFWWPEFGVIGEADGAVKYTSRVDIMREKSRQADLEIGGARFIRWVWPDAVGPANFITRLRAAFAR